MRLFMRLIFLIPSLALAFALSSCSSTGGGGSSSGPQYSQPKSTGKTSIGSTVVINGGTKDYGLKTVDGSKLRGSGGQEEDQEAPFELKGKNSKLRKAIADSWPESIHIRNDNAVVEDIYISDVGEDAVTVFDGADTVVIRNCHFAKAEDKIIQINGGNRIVIENCEFGPGFKSAIRIKKGTGKVTIRNCKFFGGQRAVVLDKSVDEPTVENCKYYDGVVPLYKG